MTTPIIIRPAPSDPPLFVKTLMAPKAKRRAREVSRILAELSHAERADIIAGATDVARGGWPDGPVAEPPKPSPLADSVAKLATVRDRMMTEFKTLGGEGA